MSRSHGILEFQCMHNDARMGLGIDALMKVDQPTAGVIPAITSRAERRTCFCRASTSMK
jgi:hypothetical protein